MDVVIGSDSERSRGASHNRPVKIGPDLAEKEWDGKIGWVRIDLCHCFWDSGLPKIDVYNFYTLY